MAIQRYRDEGVYGMCFRKSLSVLMLFVFVVSGGGLAFAASDALELLVPGELSVATEGTYPPFSMSDEKGQLSGLEIAVVKEICNRLGLTYKPVMIKWESILIGLFADKYDMISAAMDITEERQKSVVFSSGWLESGGALAVRQESPIKVVADIKGGTIGCLVASTWADIAETLGAKDVKLYKAEADALQDLNNGNIDAVITDAVAVAFAIKEANLPLRVVEERVSHIQKGLVFKPGKPNLVKAVNKALAEMGADGTYERLVREIIGINTWPEKPIETIFLK